MQSWHQVVTNTHTKGADLVKSVWRLLPSTSITIYYYYSSQKQMLLTSMPHHVLCRILSPTFPMTTTMLIATSCRKMRMRMIRMMIPARICCLAATRGCRAMIRALTEAVMLVVSAPARHSSRRRHPPMTNWLTTTRRE